MVARSWGPMERALASISGPRSSGPCSVIWFMVTHFPAKGARSPLNSTGSMTTIFSIWVCGRMERILCNCWSEDRKMARHAESLSTKAVCSAVRVVYRGTVTAPSRRLAISAIGHSGRFSLRIAMRSPGRIPHAWSARAVRATLRPNSRDVIGSHFPASRYSNMRSRLRSTAAKKMSFSVVMLIASFGARWWRP